MNRSYFRLVDRPGALPALDGLRGIAILLVVLYHAAESFRPPAGGMLAAGGIDFATPLYSGWMGVNLFFVLSGFLITWHLLRRWTPEAGGPEIGVYLTKRWLRIVPTYYVVLLIVAFGLVPHYPLEPGKMGLRIGYHLLFLQDYLPSSILAPFWSLGVEEKFYLAMPVVLLLAWRIRNLRHRLLLLAAIAAVPLVVRIGMWAADIGNGTAVYNRVWRNPFHLNLDALLLGAMAAWVVVHHAEFPRLTAAARTLVRGGAAMVVVLMVAAVLLERNEFFHQVLVMPLAAISMATLLLGTVLLPAGAAPRLEGRWLARAGKLAYPWYLTHLLMMWWVWGELTAAFPRIGTFTPGAQFAIFFPLYFAASVLAALVLHFAVEKPCLLLKDRTGARRAASPLPLTPSRA